MGSYVAQHRPKARGVLEKLYTSFGLDPLFHIISRAEILHDHWLILRSRGGQFPNLIYLLVAGKRG
jgi:hypothetical protein